MEKLENSQQFGTETERVEHLTPKEKKQDKRNSNNKLTVGKLSLAAVFTAVVCLATIVIQIPIPLGYAHLGDSMILLSSFLFGPVVGILAGGIGSMLADILTGYAIWALPTLLIKSIMPVIACFFFWKNEKRVKIFSVGSLLGAVLTLAFMVFGYVVFGAILYGSVEAGIASAPGLSLKAVVNLVIFLILGKAIPKAAIDKVR